VTVVLEVKPNFDLWIFGDEQTNCTLLLQYLHEYRHKNTSPDRKVELWDQIKEVLPKEADWPEWCESYADILNEVYRFLISKLLEEHFEEWDKFIDEEKVLEDELRAEQEMEAQEEREHTIKHVLRANPLLNYDIDEALQRTDIDDTSFFD
jgi:hypothetical protein